MKKHNIEIVKMLRKNATPMNKSELIKWLISKLARTDISANTNTSIDKRGFVAHWIELYDDHGTSRTITIPVLSDTFTFEANGIYITYGIKSPKTQVGKKNMYVIAHATGHILVSYNTTICFYDFKQNTVYFKRNAFTHSVTTSKHIHVFLNNFVNKTAIKMFAK